MIRSLYFSTANPSVGRKEAEILAAQAAEKNARLDVTGALAFNGRNFCQVLEGDDATVRELLRVIEADDRHNGFKLLDEKPIAQRHFPDWSMKLVDGLDFSCIVNAMVA